jgi:GT2 family glycosyltransferase
MDRAAIEVSFITVNYFSADFTERWVESVMRETKGVTYEILIVDNASGLDSAALKQKYPAVRVFLSPNNLGYGTALHSATRHARGHYFYFLNNDTEFKNDAGTIQYQFSQKHPEAGLIGAQLVDAAGQRALSFDYFPTLASKLVGTSALRLLRPTAYPRRDQELREPLEVDLVSGASLFMPAEIYRRVGGFDPQFFLYCEEEDLALRVHQAGGKVFVVPAARVQHAGGASSKEVLLLKKEFYISFFKFYRKHYGALKTRALKLLCMNQFLWRYAFQDNKNLWRFLLSWGLRGAPLSESLREQPGNGVLAGPLREA